jgi:hypothetical protein
VPPPLAPTERAHRIAEFRRRQTGVVGGPPAERVDGRWLATWRRGMAADLLMGAGTLVALGVTDEAAPEGPSGGLVAAVAAAAGVSAGLAVRRLAPGALAAGGCFGMAMLAFVVWRVLATSLWGGNVDLAVTLGPRLAARLGATVMVGCLWGSLRRARAAARA